MGIRRNVDRPSKRHLAARLRLLQGLSRVVEERARDRDSRAYTHTSAYTLTREPVTAINIGAGVAPAFRADAFDRGCQLTEKTMSMIAILWQVVFPQMAGPLGYGSERRPEFEPLFPPPLGPLALGRAL